MIFMKIGSLELISHSAEDGSKAPTLYRSEFFRKILYLALTLPLLVAPTLFFSAPTAAQEERPQITPGERKTPRKKDAGPRAVAVLQLSSNGKASLLPVAILVNGKFYDAAAYKADPVPMALESGTIYEGERSGNSLGLFTVNSALKANAKNTDTPWLGTGVWLPTGTEGPGKGLQAEAAPVGISTTDEPPRLSKNPEAAKPTAPSGNSTPPNDSSKASAPKSAPSGDEPPRLGKPAAQPSDSGTGGGSGQGGTATTSNTTTPDSASTKASPSQTTPDATTKPSTEAKAPTAKPSDSKSSDTKPEDSKPKVPTSDSGAVFGNRPRLRRGKPVESFAEEEVPGYSKPGTTPSATASSTSGKVVTTAAAKGQIQLVPAISDAGGPEPRTYTFEWLKGEEEDRRKQMIDLAKEQLRVYVAAHNTRQTPAQTAAKARSTRAAGNKQPEQVFDNMQMIAYDLWTSNQPIIIFSAEAHLPPPPAATPHSDVQNELQYSIVLVAYPDTYGNLRKIYSGVTDKYHLDITPRMELVDAIDADGDGRGELLFRQTTDIATGWVIYRATADKLYKMFDSVSPQ